MPYKVVKGAAGCPPAKPFGVVGPDGKKIACHADSASAKKQVAALYAKEQATLAISGAGIPASESEQITGRANEMFVGEEAVQFAIKKEEGKPPIHQAEIVLVRPGMSKNRRFYSQEAIRQAVDTKFWQGTPMFVDHADDLRMPTKRRSRDLVAEIGSEASDVWVGPDGEARANATFLGKHGREFAEFAEEAQRHVGVSIVHEFQGRRFKDRTSGKVQEQVDRFVVNHSADWVVYAAAGGGSVRFLRAAESEEDVEWSDVTPEMIRANAPAVYAAIASEASAGDDGGGTGGPVEPPKEPTPTPTPAPEPPAPGEPEPLTRQAVEQMITSAVEKDRADRAKEGETRRAVAAQLAKSGLPTKTQARVAAQFDGSSEYVEATVQEAIDSAHEEIAEIKGKAPRVKGLGASEAVTGQTDTKDENTTPALRAMEQTFLRGQVATEAGDGGKN